GAHEVAEEHEGALEHTHEMHVAVRDRLPDLTGPLVDSRGEPGAVDEHIGYLAEARHCTAFRTCSATSRASRMTWFSSSVRTRPSRIRTLPFTIVIRTSSPRVTYTRWDTGLYIGTC